MFITTSQNGDVLWAAAKASKNRCGISNPWLNAMQYGKNFSHNPEAVNVDKDTTLMPYQLACNPRYYILAHMKQNLPFYLVFFFDAQYTH
jgi:hypothetical protein